MLSIPEIATQIVNKSLSQIGEESSRTLFIVGSKSVGKSTLLYSFLDKTDNPKETLVLEYSFGRKSNQKQGIEKTVCHVWEYGGKLDILKNVLSSVPIRGRHFFIIMVDISKIKSIWSTLESCIQSMNLSYPEPGSLPELIIMCGKYDLFKNYDSEIKKFICTTFRSVAILTKAYLIFYSCKEPPLARRARDMLHSIGFGNGIPLKEKNTNFTKPLVIPKSSDTWESIGVPESTLDQVKARHISRIPPEPELVADAAVAGPQRSHPEPTLDSLAALKYKEMRNLDSLDMSIDDYLVGLQ